METGRDKCVDSPTLKEELVKGGILGEIILRNRNYDEEMVRYKAGRVLVFSKI